MQQRNHNFIVLKGNHGHESIMVFKSHKNVFFNVYYFFIVNFFLIFLLLQLILWRIIDLFFHFNSDLWQLAWSRYSTLLDLTPLMNAPRMKGKIQTTVSARTVRMSDSSNSLRQTQGQLLIGSLDLHLEEV